MNQIITKGIVLTRIEFQEADRILTILTPDHGKLRVIAKGVRRPRSKLAGGIELLSVSDITVLPGRGELSTLVSTRLITHFGNIVNDINRTMLAYDLLKRINRATEDAADEEYFDLLEQTLAGLNDMELPAGLIDLWFTMQMLRITGYGPNLLTDAEGNKLGQDYDYQFDFENSVFIRHKGGPYNSNHIKLMRLSAASNLTPSKIGQIKDIEKHLEKTLALAKNILRQHVRM